MNDSISDALNTVRERIRNAVAESGRSADAVQLLAVSKTKPASSIRAAYAHGQRLFGESYLQEALAKQHELADLDIEWHFIGPIQSNKTREIATHFSWVHGVDRLKIAQRLSDQRPHDQSPLNVLLQVNVSGEASKSGVALADAEALAIQIAALPNLRLRGLMTVPAPCHDPQQQRAPFRKLREMKERFGRVGLELDTLSMGMTDDLESAIAEGATIVRIGTAIFGAR
ncbi:MAG: YggS family pyridoxal phosphate-dependent enzyme [Gammaproteobacteria bacterium]|nr:YggS family pyridoxal phosphate-dependent enzyme [Gammaproteobacteria bacterium]MCP5138066.1 YggS family pyridoxal phosphate-dependent enzyme [Gammaproteobacteria bacterium]